MGHPIPSYPCSRVFILSLCGQVKLAAVSQMKQVLILPISFFGYGSIGIRGVGGSMDSLLGIHRSTISMSGNMRSCHSLTCGTRSRAAGTHFSYFTGTSIDV